MQDAADARWCKRALRVTVPGSERLAKDGGEGGIRTHVPLTGQDAFEAPPLRPLRYLSVSYFARWGPGERIVFEPYTKEVYDETFQWIKQHGIFEDGKMGAGQYDQVISESCSINP